MNEITFSRSVAKDICKMRFKNKAIAAAFQPGQFVVIRTCREGERIPLTVVEARGDEITLIVQKVGYTTEKICALEEGRGLCDVAGPLGRPSEIKKYGNALMIGGGIGAAPLKPIAAAMKEAGNSLTVIQGARSENYLILQEELKSIADSYILVTDDGSAGEKGFVTLPFERIIEKEGNPDFVFAVGPVPMMKAVAGITRPRNIPLTVSLNPIMVDGTGMCGSCRVEVGGETKFGCVDGPEFDGNQVNFQMLENRLGMYEKEEKKICSRLTANG